MSHNRENEPPSTGATPIDDGVREAPHGMSGMDTGTAPWGVSGEGDARHGDAADAGGDTTPSDDDDDAADDVREDGRR
ncbi:hypothetical protein [Microbacterium sp. 179-I 3D4 NHS]|uniref:hypothetical protein n=1 Tax=Microbacterium sp. 179-I 3D4 NHS TaxID=3142381 RepID=UPI0039A0D866